MKPRDAMNDEELIAWINAASLEDLLRKWRFEPPPSPLFMGRVGEHYKTIMAIRRDELGPDAWTAASNKVGWQR